MAQWHVVTYLEHLPQADLDREFPNTLRDKFNITKTMAAYYLKIEHMARREVAFGVVPARRSYIEIVRGLHDKSGTRAPGDQWITGSPNGECIGNISSPQFAPRASLHLPPPGTPSDGTSIEKT